MADIDQLYADLSGDKPTASIPGYAEVLLIARARKSAQAEDIQERRAGIRVIAAIGGRDGMEAILAFLADPDPSVRDQVLQVGLDAGEVGRPVVRAVLEDPAAALVLRALHELTERADKAASGRVRKLLQHREPKIRKGGIEFLEKHGGPALRPEVEALLKDVDPEVAAAAQKAIQTFDGGRKRPPTAPKPPQPPTPIVPKPMEVDTKPQETDPESAAPPTAETTEAAPSEPHPPTSASTAEPPKDPVTTAKRIGAGGALSALDAGSMAVIQSALRTDNDPYLAIGASRLAAAQQWTAWVPLLRGLLSHADARVRGEAVRATSAIAAASVVPAVLQLLRDPDRSVQKAAIDGLVGMALRLKKERLAEMELAALVFQDEDPLKAHRDLALSRLKT